MATQAADLAPDRTRDDEGEGTPEAAIRRGSLRPALDVIPPEAYRNPTWKGLAYLGRDLALYALLVWALIEVSNPFAVLALELPMALVVGGLFIMGHDVAHGALFKNRRLSAITGR